jgi:hypothetical protein
MAQQTTTYDMGGLSDAVRAMLQPYRRVVLVP